MYIINLKISKCVSLKERAQGEGQKGPDPPSPSPIKLQIFKNFWGFPGADPRNPYIFFLFYLLTPTLSESCGLPWKTI